MYKLNLYLEWFVSSFLYISDHIAKYNQVSLHNIEDWYQIR